jgi:hypothetical protein
MNTNIIGNLDKTIIDNLDKTIIDNNYEYEYNYDNGDIILVEECNKFICICKKVFSYKQNLWRHKKTCKEKDILEIKLSMEQMKNELVDLKNKQEMINNTTNNTNNNKNNNTNNNTTNNTNNNTTNNTNNNTTNNTNNNTTNNTNNNNYKTINVYAYVLILILLIVNH